MTNTYTSAGLIKQQYDTNDNTWGDYENTNKDIQQSLIAGRYQVDLSAGDVTLPDIDGTADAGKNHLYETIGTIPANRSLIVPTKTRHFKVLNNCVGAFTVTVKTLAGTGIVVPTGANADLECNGTNVILGTTYLGNIYGTTNFNDSTIQRPTLQDYAHTANIVSSSGSTQTVDVTTANTWIITLDANCTITLSNPSPSGSECVIRIRLIQDGTGGRSITFAGGTFKWLGQTTQSTAPTFSTAANYVSEVEFRTVDGGTTYTAQLVGSGSSSGGGVSPISGTYVAVGASGKVSSSPDGSTWTLQATQFSGADISGCDQYNGRFHFYKNAYGDSSAIGKYTTNGTSFTAWGTGGSNIWLGTTGRCTNGNAVCLNLQQTGAGSAYSVDNWTTSSSISGSTFSTSSTYFGAINGNDILWVSGTTTTGAQYSQSGGVAASSISHGGVTVTAYSAVNFLNGVWLISGTNGVIAYKTTVNGTTLTQVNTMDSNNQANKFLYTGTKWVAAGNAGKVANASSIASWTNRTTGLSGNIVDMANNGAIVICVTDVGEIARSADDGDSWTVLSVPGSNPFGGTALTFVKYRLTQFWTGGGGGKLGASPDGITFGLVNSGFGSSTIYGMEAA